MYASPSAINTMSFDKINHFVNNMFNIDNLHLVSTGVDDLSLQDIAQEWAPVSGQKFTPPPSKYKGGMSHYVRLLFKIRVFVAKNISKTFKLVHCIDETRNCATEFTEKT